MKIKMKFKIKKNNLKKKIINYYLRAITSFMFLTLGFHSMTVYEDSGIEL